jgi:hypothetical protein
MLTHRQVFGNLSHSEIGGDNPCSQQLILECRFWTTIHLSGNPTIQELRGTRSDANMLPQRYCLLSWVLRRKYFVVIGSATIQRATRRDIVDGSEQILISKQLTLVVKSQLYMAGALVGIYAYTIGKLPNHKGR